MKADIHPEYVDAVIRCSCGYVLKTRSTRKELHVNSCSHCHPYYTGTAKLLDTEGRVQRFQKKYAAKTVKAAK